MGLHEESNARRAERGLAPIRFVNRSSPFTSDFNSQSPEKYDALLHAQQACERACQGKDASGNGRPTSSREESSPLGGIEGGGARGR